jgi:hypothetical protein
MSRVNTQATQQAATTTKAAAGLLQRKCACGTHTTGGAECDECGDRRGLQRRAAVGGSRTDPREEVPSIVHDVLRSPGSPLDASARAFMESRFGHDLSRVQTLTPQKSASGLEVGPTRDSFEDEAERVSRRVTREPSTHACDESTTRDRQSFAHVRVHTDDRAAQSARAVGAVAYTVGNHVVFDAGQYQPHTSAGRQLLAHELTHTIQQGAALSKGMAATTIQRAMKFELQTNNIVWRTGGKKTEKLPRKFGPTVEPKNSRFLHKGLKGKPPEGDKEGTAVELQSEARGFVEFETPSWHRDWCEVKERIQEAVDMVSAIDKSKVVRTIGGVKTVKFPFDVAHLKKTKAFTQGLQAGESLDVEILDPDWSAKIQASEAFELPQFESYLKEHMSPARFTSITGSAKKILQDANTKKLPDKDLVNLQNLLQIIVEYITEAQKWNTSNTHLAKENISLMSRTSFSSMFQVLLSKDEQKLFTTIVGSDAILKEMGVTRKTLVFPSGFVGHKSPGPTIHQWLVSIHSQPRDLLSSLGGDNRAMGRFPVETEKDKKDTNLVKFEARATSGHLQERPAVDKKDVATGRVLLGGWVAFAEEVFKAAHTKRARTGSTELIYDPKKCP